MADNIGINTGSGATVSTEEVTNLNGDAVPAQHLQRVANALRTADGTAIDLPGDAIYGLDVDVRRLPNGVVDTFGKLQIAGAINDVDVQFYRDVPANLVAVTAAGGGAATTVSGMMQLASSTGTTGEVRAVSTDVVYYRSGGEVYAMFTAAFLDGGVANCNQRIGLYDDNNGFFIGFEGATAFGVVSRSGGVDTRVTQSSFNGDTLNSDPGSRFTRNGVPENANFALLNLFRIRFGWLGAAPIRFEIASPDGEWVTFHTIKQPNTAAVPSILTPDLPITAHIVKTSGATDVRLRTACWGAGSTYDKPDFVGSATLDTALNSVVNLPTQGLSTIRLRIGSTTTGTFIVETTADGLNWITHPQVVRVGAIDTFVIAAETPTAGTTYVVNAAAWRGIRVRTASTLGATVPIAYIGDDHALLIKGSDMAPPPHNIGFPTMFKAAQYTSTQTGAALWTPAAGRRIAVTYMQIQAGGTTAANVQVWFGASADTTYTRGTDMVLFDGEFAPSATNKPGFAITFPVPIVADAVDRVLRVTSSAGLNPLTVVVHGYEIG